MKTTRNKRKRSQSPVSICNEAEKAADSYERSENFYFDDGNIILVAEKTAFRVHQGQMARHSPVFRDMFSTVKQPNNAESFDGCSVVKLSDRSIDVQRLLSALYDFKPLVSQDFNMQRGVLRMAHNYLIDDLRQYSFDALALAYPSSLAQWDRYEGNRPSAPHLIFDARQTGAEILLPSAFYHLVCTTSSAEVLDLKPVMETVDLSTFHKGKETVLSLWADFLLTEVLMTECDEKDCAKKYQEQRDLVLKKVLDPGYFQKPDPLQYLQQFWNFADLATELCEVCKDIAKTKADARRLKIWDELPGIFGFPCWDDLAKK